MRWWGSVAAVTLLFVLAAAGCSRVTNQTANNGVRSNSNSSAANARAAAQQPDNVRRVTITELRDMLEQNKAVVVDVRGDMAFEQEHIKGSLDIPEAQLNSRLNDLPKDKLIVLYCSWPSEHSSARAAQTLQKAGFENVAALLGGTNAWKTAGFPMEKGK